MERDFEVLDELRSSDLRSEVARRMERPLDTLPDGSGPGRRFLAAAVALAVFVGAALFAWTVWSTTPTPTPRPAADPWAWAPRGWTELPPLPVTSGGEAWLWAGDRLLAWGGCADGEVDACAPTPGGWSFDATSRRWDPMPTAPLGGAYAGAVRMGEEALFLGLGEGGRSSQAFDPADGSWRVIPDAPVDLSGSPVVSWTGDEVLVWGGNHGAAFSPVEGTWRRIADAPVEMNLASGAWSGSELYVIGSLLDRRNRAESRTAEGLAYDPGSDRWRTLPPSALSPQAVSASWVGGRFVAWDFELGSQTFDPGTGVWSEPGVVPLTFNECYNGSATVAGLLFGWYCGDAALYDPRSAVWTAIGGGPLDDTIYSEAYERRINIWRFAELVPADGVLVTPLTGITLTETGEACYGCAGSPLSYWVYRPPTASEAT